jgi:hypothetical protein
MCANALAKAGVDVRIIDERSVFIFTRLLIFLFLF